MTKRDISTSWFYPGALAYGGDYSPEQWPREIWHEDVALMKEAGVNLVSVGIFSWALLQPEEDRFDFEWMDDLLNLLHENGIGADLATPTASPPAWFFKKYPQARAVTKEGVPLGFGARGIVSPSSPEYKAAAVRIATELAKRYGTHPAVKMWHIHNEYGVPISDEYSDYAQDAFRRWLQDRYETLEALNDAWGTRFWGQYYHQWDEVGAPRLTAAEINPSQKLDYQRFSDWAMRQCFIAERNAIHEYAPQPVTTNFMAYQNWSTDLWAWAKEVDIVSNDHYLWAADPTGHVALSMAADFTRSLADGKPWMLLEHSTSAVNWQERNVAKRPQEMLRNSLTHVGRGADAVMFFQWRASRAGTEKFHSAMLPHTGTKSRIWKEVVELGADLVDIGQIQGSVVQAPVAILADFESNWARSGAGHPSIEPQLPGQLREFYQPLWEQNITADFALPSHDLSKYKLVIAPAQYILSQEEAHNLNRYVEAGGTLVVSYYSGIVDRNDRVHLTPVDDGGFMSLLEPSLGVVVEEFLPLRKEETGSVHLFDKDFPSTLWQEALWVSSAEIIGTYQGGPATHLGDSQPAVTRNKFGSGRGYYLSTQLPKEAINALLTQALEEAGVDRKFADSELEIIVRTQTEDPGKGREAAEYLIAVNHGNNPEYLPVSGLDLLHNREKSVGDTLAPGSVAVLQVAADNANPA